jgi:type I restriction enzyme R subunit
MALTDIDGEYRLVQRTFADHLHDHLGWESVYAYIAETFGSHGTLGRAGPSAMWYWSGTSAPHWPT